MTMEMARVEWKKRIHVVGHKILDKDCLYWHVFRHYIENLWSCSQPFYCRYPVLVIDVKWISLSWVSKPQFFFNICQPFMSFSNHNHHLSLFPSKWVPIIGVSYLKCKLNFLNWCQICTQGNNNGKRGCVGNWLTNKKNPTVFL